MQYKKIWQLIAEYLDLNKSERRGIIILMSIIIIVIVIRVYFPYPKIDKSLSDTLEISEKHFDTLKKILSQKQEYKKVYNNYNNYKPYNKTDYSKESQQKQLTPFEFNPNGLNKEQWIKMGFSEKQAELIKKFEAKGGKFYAKEDVAKLWCISNKDYKILEPYILLPSQNDSNFKHNKYQQKTNFKEEKQIQIVEINTASDKELMDIPGIGKYYATQIIKQRRKLGGFCNKEQLLEINKMDTIKFLKIESYITVNKDVIRKINVNDASLEELRTHPYFTYNTSLALINYRERHGKFQKTEDIKKCDLFTDELYKKILPYINIE